MSMIRNRSAIILADIVNLKDIKSKWLQLFAVSCVILIFGDALFFHFITWKLFFHSDSAVKNILAEEIYSSKSLFPKGWIYVNGDLWFLMPQLLVLPLLLLFKNSFTLHAVAASAEMGLCLGMAWLILKETISRSEARLTVLAVLASGISTPFVIWGYGEGAYDWQTFLIFIVYWLYIRFDNLSYHGNKKIVLLFLISSLVIAIITVNNPIRIVVYGIAPMLAAELALYLINGQRVQFKFWGSAFLGLMGGVFAYRMITKNVEFAWGAMNLTFRSGEPQLKESLGKVIFEISSLFNIIPSTSTKPTMLLLLWHGISVGILTIVVIASINAVRNDKTVLRIMAIHGIISFLAISWACLVIAPLAEATSRYLISPLFLLIMSIGAWVDKIKTDRVRNGIIVLISLGSVFVASQNYVMPISGKPVTNKMTKVLNILKERNLTTGYGTYWNSHVGTILSGGEVIIRPVNIISGKFITPFFWLSSRNWYSTEHVDAHGRTFVLFTDDEFKTLKKADFEIFYGAPLEQLSGGGYHVLVFPYDIMGKWRRYAANSSLDVAREIVNYKISLNSKEQLHTKPGEKYLVKYNFSNLEKFPLSSFSSSKPFNIGFHLYDEKGTMLQNDYARQQIAIDGNASIDLTTELIAPMAAGTYNIKIALVQEGVRWFENGGVTFRLVVKE